MHVIATMRSKVAPSRGRGLKRKVSCAEASKGGRPFTGAWIETYFSRHGDTFLFVAPSRGRGLKHFYFCPGLVLVGVAPSRGRGLKRFLVRKAFTLTAVAPSRGRGLKP